MVESVLAVRFEKRMFFLMRSAGDAEADELRAVRRGVPFGDFVFTPRQGIVKVKHSTGTRLV